MAIQRTVLSGSTNGRPITVAAVAASCNMVIHTAGAVTGDDNVDEIWAWAIPTTTSTASRQLMLQYGSDATGDMHEMSIARDPANPIPVLVVPGINLNNSLKLTAWACACSHFSIIGHAFEVRA